MNYCIVMLWRRMDRGDDGAVLMFCCCCCCCVISHILLHSDLFEADVAGRSNGHRLGLVSGEGVGVRDSGSCGKTEWAGFE